MSVAALVLALAPLLLPAVPPVAGSGEPVPGWRWPLAGPVQVTRTFAPGPTPYAPGHRGIDLAGAPGQLVLAAGAGRVSYAGLLAGRGVVVVVHGALRTTYEPVAATVHTGETVTAGEMIGSLLVGHEGCAAAACLHWGLLRGQTYLDPARLLDAGPVRLLPTDGSAAGTALTQPLLAGLPGTDPADPGAVLSGALPAGALPAGALPAGDVPSGALPAGALPAGEVPSGVPPSGTSPGTGQAPSTTLRSPNTPAARTGAGTDMAADPSRPAVASAGARGSGPLGRAGTTALIGALAVAGTAALVRRRP